MRCVGLTIQDTIIRDTVDSCFPEATVAVKYKWRSRLAKALDDRKNGFEITTRSLWNVTPDVVQVCRMVKTYNAALHQHLRAECK